MRKALQIAGGLLAFGITVSLVALIGYALPHMQDLKDEIHGLNASTPPSLDAAAAGAVNFAEQQRQPAESTGSGPGYAFNSPAPAGSSLPAGHWCATGVIGYRIDFAGARLAGRTPAQEKARWHDAFAEWTTASAGAYRFKYLGEGHFPTTRAAAGKSPIATTSLHPGEIAITYAASPAQATKRWNGYVYTSLSDALGMGGVVPVLWKGADAGTIREGMIVLDATDAAADPHDLPTEYVHELGHALGLSHVSDPGQVMYAHADSETVINDGDKAGIRRLAQAACR